MFSQSAKRIIRSQESICQWCFGLYFLKKSFDSFRNDHSIKWLKFLDKIFKIFIRKGVIIVSILLMKVSWCKLEVVSVNTTTDSLAKRLFFHWWHSVHSRQPKSFFWLNCSKLQIRNVFNGNRLSHICGSSSFYFDWKFRNGLVQRFFKGALYERTFWEIVLSPRWF
jgi:hypothetical protein